MRKPDLMIIAAVVLCVCTGVILGQSFSFEVKLSDLIALTATLITFIFAYSGLKSNKAQYINSITPIVTKFESGHNNNFSYAIFVNNYGTGPALDFSVNVLLDGKEFSLAGFLNELVKLHGDMENRYSHPAVLAASTEHEVLSLKAKDYFQYVKVHDTLQSAQLVVQFTSIQQREFTETFLLGFE
ncbi:hypothetical protein PAT01_36650 [Pseudoalteromonas atlantica]|uniref:DUF2393 domain-containing protein n=1 Tax=Pseudoalteromonas atlantica TaxID=288 RepID=A0ABQ0UIS2_PSEAF|nr:MULTISPECIES: hypothetical protein [unclassified Pseudoalteromonas]MCK8137319.1 hypothetical protein [Pseudoalteromonas sp. 2CM28B]MCW1720535.1 hypothetical protein [Pseudoalteromonas sp. A3]GEK78361.1 hypothetical protein PAT01_36650 [Pseudoalteromonas atlantica]